MTPARRPGALRVRALTRDQVSRSARVSSRRSNVARHTKHSANSRTLSLKQRQSWPPLRLSVKRRASARSKASFTRYLLARRALAHAPADGVQPVAPECGSSRWLRSNASTTRPLLARRAWRGKFRMLDWGQTPISNIGHCHFHRPVCSIETRYSLTATVTQLAQRNNVRNQGLTPIYQRREAS
jgi:hypothetical protein